MKVPSNRLKDIIKYYKELILPIYGNDESLSLLYLLIEEFFQFTKLDIVKDDNLRLSESEMLKIHFAVKDLLNQKPIQHILGYAEFCGLEFKVNENVLVPRPETEELVELILSKHKNQNLTVLDVGTGSGCIPISIKAKRPEFEITAVDVSLEALEVAKYNALSNNTTIKFLNADILYDVSRESLGKFDVIVSNPPYVRNSEKVLMQKNVLDFDPHLALFVSDDDPLLFYRSIADFSLDHLNDKGFLYFEINEAFGSETMKMLEERGLSKIELYQDFRGKDRFVSAQLIQK